MYTAAVRADRFFDLSSGWYSAGMAALLLALALARLEAALFSGTFLLVALALGRREGGAQLRHSIAVAAALGVGGALYIAFNLVTVGLPVPVSGLVKALWHPAGPPYRLLLTELSWFVSPLRLQRVFEHPVLTAASCLALLFGLGVFLHESWRRGQRGLVLLALNCAILVAYNGLFTRQAFHWYGWPALMLGTLGCFGLMSRWLPRPARCAGPIPRWVVGAVAAIALLYGAGTTHRVATRDYDQLYDWSSSPVLMDAALRFIERDVPRETQLAGDSVGMLSYLSGRDIINVEGLVGDRTFYRALRERRERQLLRERGVNWVVATRLDNYALPCARVESWDLAERERQLRTQPVAGSLHFYRIDYAPCDVAPTR